MKMKSKFGYNPLAILGIFFVLASNCTKDNDNNTITDIDGNIYTSVTIGTQVWMVENLNVTRYRNGDSLPNIVNDSLWGSLTSGAYCDYNNTPGNSTIYGKLYNWFAVHDSRNIAPKGWHIPSLEEWDSLIKYLGGDTIAGGKLKDTILWASPNTGASNSRGFKALPGGMRTAYRLSLHNYYKVNFINIDSCGYWWTANMTNWDDGSQTSWGKSIVYNDIFIHTTGRERGIGFSVRCIKD